jgi:mono/diheme cytochrome c family protein
VAVRTLITVISTTGLLLLQSCANPAQEPSAARVSGAYLYKTSCSGCHGADAQGNGPVAEFLTVPVPDLTRIAARRGGRFPDDDIYRIIDGQADLKVHGLRHMPVWGYEFFGDDPDDEVAHRQATEKVDRLVSFLRSMQRE